MSSWSRSTRPGAATAVSSGSTSVAVGSVGGVAGYGYGSGGAGGIHQSGGGGYYGSVPGGGHAASSGYSTQQSQGFGSASQLENEIERAREDANWKRVMELADTLLRQRPEQRQMETLTNFLIGEAKLEEFLEEFPPIQDKNVSRAKEGLAEAKDYLSKTIGEDAKKLGVHLDSYILLGKLNFAMGNYSEALRFYERATLDALPEKQLPPRSLKIMAEAFAVEAMCHEKVDKPTGIQRRSTSSTAKTGSDNASVTPDKRAAQEAKIVKCYETAADLAVLYLQTADKSAAGVMQSTWSVTSGGGGASSSPVPPPIQQMSTHQKLGPILESALLKAPAINMKSGDKMRAVNKYRQLLQAEETDSIRDIRRNILVKLAESLLHGVSEVSYSKPELELGRSKLNSRPTAASAVESPWKPKKHAGIIGTSGSSIGVNQQQPSVQNKDTLFVPTNRFEEILLALILSENLARKDAILSQAPEFFAMRSTKFRDAIITYDLIAIALSRVRNYRLLGHMLQHSMKFSFNEPHTWTQFGLVMAGEGRTFRSLLVFRELAARNQADLGSCLVAAKLCYERLHLYEEGVTWSERALSKAKGQQGEASTTLRARCYVYIGLGQILRVRNVENHTERRKSLAKAAECFKTATNVDPDDHLSAYYSAYHAALTRDVDEAIRMVKKSLDLNPEHLGSLNLLTLLLTVKSEYDEALEVVKRTLEEFPDNIPILALRIRLEEVVSGQEEAILVAKAMLKQWQTICEQQSQLLAGYSDETGGEIVNGGTAAVAAGGVYSTIHGNSTIQHHAMANPKDANVAGSVDYLNGYATIGRNSAITAAGGGSSMTGVTVGGGTTAFDALSDKDSISLHAHSMTASHVEKTLSEVASSVSAAFPRPERHDPAYTQMRIWLLTCELQLRAGNIPEAEACLTEARQISPLSYHCMYVRGLLCEARGELETARHFFENSLGVNPSHVASLHHLGKIHHVLGFHRLAEQSLKIAVRIDPNNEELWTLLGEVKEAVANDIVIKMAAEADVVKDEFGLPAPKNTFNSHHQQTRRAASTSAGDKTRILEESEMTPTVATQRTLLDEAGRMFQRSAECHAIGLSLHNSSPVVPFNTIPLFFE